MGISPSDGERYADEIRRTYAQAETDIIKMLADELGSDTYREDWAKLKLRRLRKVRGKISSEVIDSLDVEDQVRAAIEDAYRDGSDSAIADLRSVKRAGGPVGDIDTNFGMMNKRAIRSAANQTVGKLKSTHLRIFRHVDDVYRRAVSQAQTSVLTGTATRREASQKVLNRFANRGVTSFIDDAGRCWNLSSYSEMAVRTSTGRSAVNGAMDRIEENGRDLVVVSDHHGACKKCRNWEGEILSMSGNSDKYSSVGDARGGGLFHPMCRHTLNAYIPGWTKTPDETADPEIAEHRRQQRYLERGIRKWKRRKAAAMSDKVMQKTQAKISGWQGRMQNFIDRTDRRRLYSREQIGKAR